jgi:stage III sporulation protein AG
LSEKSGKKAFGKLDRRGALIAVVIAASAGILLLLWSAGGKSETQEEVKKSNMSEIVEYCEYLEGKAEKLCESVKGISGVTVNITLEGGFEQVYATDRQITQNGQSLEYVKIGSGASSKLCATAVRAPTIAGIGVSCKGCRDSTVKAELTALLSASFGVGTNKIYITEGD